jgi:hypothetical protein
MTAATGLRLLPARWAVPDGCGLARRVERALVGVILGEADVHYPKMHARGSEFQAQVWAKLARLASAALPAQ